MRSSNMRIFLAKLLMITLLTGYIGLAKASEQPKNNYLESLFAELDAREEKPSLNTPRLYNKLTENSIAFKILEKYPNLVIGKISFMPQLPSHFKDKRKAIEEGQILIKNSIITQEMMKKTVTFQDIIKQIDAKFEELNLKLTTENWVIIASAFRTLSAPNASHEQNALGIFLAEYIILQLINDLEGKTDRHKEDKEILASLYYILSEIYQNIANNPQKYHLAQKKKSQTNSPLYLAFPRDYFADYDYGPLEYFTEGDIVDYDISYPYPYHYSVLTDFFVSFDLLYGYHLDLLKTAVILAPYYDLAWFGIIDFIAVNLRVPYFRDRFSHKFWDDYFPRGIVGVQPIFINRLHRQWDRIDRGQILGARAHERTIITQSLKQMRSSGWRSQQEAQRAARLNPQQLREQGALKLNQRDIATTRKERRIIGLDRIQPEVRAQRRIERQQAPNQPQLERRAQPVPPQPQLRSVPQPQVRSTPPVTTRQPQQSQPKQGPRQEEKSIKKG